MMNKNIISILFITSILIGCLRDKRVGQFGVTEDISTSQLRKFYKATYIPNQFKYRLLDGSMIEIDTAWAEVMWAYDKNGHPDSASNFGYNFIIPIKDQNFEKFIFKIALADTLNESFTNGIEKNRCVVNPLVLHDTIMTLLEQKNPDKNQGWLKPIITDTILFVKVKN